MRDAFYQSGIEHPHLGRARALLKAHPEIRQLMVRNPWTALIALSVVVFQTGIAFAMGKLGMHYWWFTLIIAYFVGAFANHANYVIIHDATHNLIFRRKSWNKFVAALADLPNLNPGAMGFGVYHLKHHSHQGDYEWDADLANHWEARLVSNKSYRKAIWLALFPFFQLTRPPRLKAITMWDRWFCLNFACAIVYDVFIVYFCGWSGFLYLAFSFIFSVGLHPVGARWIQEHYTNDPEQETYSYYGPINRLCLNMGYHNEHHDLPSIPWNNLPRLRAMAPEFYDTLKYHPSWTRLLFQFIFDKHYSLFSRIERFKETTPDAQLDEEARSLVAAGH
ncbi:MAG TPA: fatty acid desaturase [Chthoniobacterales bacterium]|jgi:Fatty acid desaturase|nr:fatty acid desaturase [Chthoniobacterales bacterium]